LATVKSSSSKPRRARRWPWAVLVVFFVLAAGWWAYGDAIAGNAKAGTAYAARVGCSCSFVAGRSLDDCGKDKLAGMELVSLSRDAEAKSVTATMALIASDTASYREGYGCVLEGETP